MILFSKDGQPLKIRYKPWMPKPWLVQAYTRFKKGNEHWICESRVRETYPEAMENLIETLKEKDIIN